MPKTVLCKFRTHGHHDASVVLDTDVQTVYIEVFERLPGVKEPHVLPLDLISLDTLREGLGRARAILSPPEPDNDPPVPRKARAK